MQHNSRAGLCCTAHRYPEATRCCKRCPLDVPAPEPAPTWVHPDWTLAS
jgi:hypothetical protein